MSATPTPPSPGKPPPPSQHAFQAPTGTRDFYPAELNRLRYIQDAWRRTSINHGFEEIDGPTFEHLELYTAKSGEGIVSELFSFERFGGEKTFALRPEFTPTLARMYASKAASLPKPTKWFWQQNCYRAERPQRGRLREFSQWNCDIIGSEFNTPDAPKATGGEQVGLHIQKAQRPTIPPFAHTNADAEIISTCVSALEHLGLTPTDARVKYNLRGLTIQLLRLCGTPADRVEMALSFVDRRAKIDPLDAKKQSLALGLDIDLFDKWCLALASDFDKGIDALSVTFKDKDGHMRKGETSFDLNELHALKDAIRNTGCEAWCTLDLGIARGLAYYTGMVFEVHEASGAERAIAGGGRYDKLIETFGGPPTPAVGFGMGDVVLSLVLQDKGLMPSDDQIAEKLGQRPDALVIAYEDKNDAAKSAAAEGAIAPTLAALRKANLHARRSYKTTKNVGKLIQDAAKIRARFCVIIESATTAQLKNMDTQEQKPVTISDLPSLIAQR